MSKFVLHLAVMLSLVLHSVVSFRPIVGSRGGTDAQISDEVYTRMQQAIVAGMDGVTGYDFIFNWFKLLSPNVTVCYPFVGAIDADSGCLFGITAVVAAWGEGPFTNYTVIQTDSFWLSVQGAKKVGVWHYTISSSYVSPAPHYPCAVQFSGVVMWSLDPANSSAIGEWLEMPDSNRIATTYPCKL